MKHSHKKESCCLRSPEGHVHLNTLRPRAKGQHYGVVISRLRLETCSIAKAEGLRDFRQAFHVILQNESTAFCFRTWRTTSGGNLEIHVAPSSFHLANALVSLDRPRRVCDALSKSEHSISGSGQLKANSWSASWQVVECINQIETAVLANRVQIIGFCSRCRGTR